MAKRFFGGRALHLGQALAVVCILFTAVWPQAGAAATATVVSTDVLNVRACAGPDCAILGTLELGDTVTITGVLSNGYYPIQYGNTTGYVYHLYLMQNGTVPLFNQGDSSCSRVAFVFNIGIGYTPSQSILNTLITKDVDATMFPMGSFARSQPDYLRQLNNAGFPIGTHGDQAIYLTQTSDAGIRTDLANSKIAIENVIGRPIDPYFTAYAADTDSRVRGIASTSGYLPVEWKVPAADYATWATEADVYNRVVNGMYPGAIVEFHLDGPATETSTARALPRIIDTLRQRGYTFSTIGELAEPCREGIPSGTKVTARVVNTGGAGLRCRATPSTSGVVLTVLGEGSVHNVRGDTFGEWVPLYCGSQSGWSHISYLALTTQVTTPPPPAPVPTQPPAPVPTIPPATTSGTATVVNTGGVGLRCRVEPTLTAGVITVVPEGRSMPTRGGQQGGWVPVRCSDRDGWVSASYVRVSTTTPSNPAPPPPPSTATSGVVRGTGGDGLNCRASGSLSGGVITVVPEGTRLTVRGASQGGWVPVTCANRDGWVSSTYFAIAP